MGQLRLAARQGQVLMIFGSGLALALAWMGFGGPAGAAPRGDEDPPTQESPGDTLLPPADDPDVSIVPVDEGRAESTPESSEPDATPAAPRDIDPSVVAGWALVVVGSLLATAAGVTRLARMLYVWRSPASLGASGFGRLDGPKSTTFSLLVPAQRINKRLAMTLDQLAVLEHPAFEILVVVQPDDMATRGAALAAAARHPDRLRLVDDRQRRPTRSSRAAALNAALAEAGGAVIGVIEPGDDVHPRLLRHVEACLSDPDVAAVQGGVQLVATRRRWFSARTIVERYFWSRSRLHFHARQNFTPLEGSTAFVRASLLREAGGWDERCSAEASELGIRLSVQGAPIVVAYDPELATRTPAPERVVPLLRLQVHSIRGYIQVLRRGVWRRLPRRRQRLLARAMLTRPLVDAAAPLMAIAALTAAVVVGAPTWIDVVVLLPLLPALTTLGVELAAMAELRRVDGEKVLMRDRFFLLLSALPYQLLAALAALYALVSELFDPGRGGPSMPVAPASGSPLDRLALDDTPADPDQRILDLSDRPRLETAKALDG